MPGVALTYSFGDFLLDPSQRRLTRAGKAVSLTEHQIDVLGALVAQAGETVSKDALVEAAWGDVAVTDNSVEQVISALRKALGDTADPRLIETVPRRGYRFRGEVTVVRAAPRATDAQLAAMLEPYRSWIEGRAALETLESGAVQHARGVFEGAVAEAPEYASAHIGLANALVLHFESTRADETPDIEALRRAASHASEACRLDAQSGEAWATQAVVLHRGGEGTRAIAAARRAVSLEPDNWRHHFRLAYVGWGEERLRAGQRALMLFPGFALAHWLRATVYVARRAFDAAEQELRSGTAAQDAQQGTQAFASIGAHWLLGLLHLARGDEQDAIDAFRRELAFEASRHLFARECAANTWYAIGALRLRQSQRSDARLAFENALERVPGHALAMIGLSMTQDSEDSRLGVEAEIEGRLAQLATIGLAMEAATGRAACAACRGNAEQAAAILDAALSAAPPGNGGWLIPIDPLLNVAHNQQPFTQVLARLRTRAA